MTNAKLSIGDEEYEVPIVEGTEAERGLDISKLRSTSGLVTLDGGFGNTASTKSAITYINGEQGILRYRGIPIEELAEKSTFVETSYLLIKGELPNKDQLAEYSLGLTRHSMLHEDMRHLFDGFPQPVIRWRFCPRWYVRCPRIIPSASIPTCAWMSTSLGSSLKLGRLRRSVIKNAWAAP